MLGEFTAQSAQLDSMLTSARRQSEEMAEKFDGFVQDIESRTKEVTQLHKNATEQLSRLRQQIPDVEEYSAEEVFIEALNHDSPQAKAALCSRLLVHPDSTSKVMESAGDLMRKTKRNSLAMDLYKAAAERDPDNLTAQVELLALQIEDDYSKRESAIEDALQLIKKHPKPGFLARIFNAIIHVQRYDLLLHFVDEVFAVKDQFRTKEANALLYRNRGVALLELGRTEESTAAYEKALEISPDDENVLKAFLRVLEDRGDEVEYLRICDRLIELDPSDVRYRITKVRKLSDLRKWKEAHDALKMAFDLDPQGGDLYSLQMLQQKVAVALKS